ncbi:AAA domain-containing protein [Glaciimonas sp. Gout2]|uniref:DEAD/DEAH box helicase n=1 Tax=unclassified Glaciimonas TaxID=2644401 RepID=UPI002B237DE8|nr:MULTISPECIES: AAA domain-containing protein [unclassified Glaciimonas]MEB0011625.1 AAA domain-containing protein [Glaciimonas sp. Cout2]MEB0081422.1 AAA domain-containing protein [Glaciimonas sp. Gout2]
MTSEYIKTLRYWFDVEALMYPDIPKENVKRRRRAFKKQYAELLPWQVPPYDTRQEEFKYFVYFGVVDKKILEKELLKLYAGAEDAENYSGNQKRNVYGNTFLCAIEMTGAGGPVVSSLQLAAYAIAFAERKNQKRYDYEAISFLLKTKIENLLSRDHDSVVDGYWFEEIIEILIEELDWSPRALMASSQIYVHTIPLLNENGRTISPPTEMDPINSFYLEDIQRILNLGERGSESQQIKRYLQEERPMAQKIDVSQLDIANRLLSAEKFPLGRWPSEFPLFMMQQVAVNTALHEMKDGGIFSVNGPPGTGKTTLLMDVIAARIIDRAEVLASFANPAEAFSRNEQRVEYPETSKLPAGDGCYLVDQRLLDFGIVVASANNNAVENITRDLPNIKKVSSTSLTINGTPFNYFGAIAESIVNDEANKRKKSNKMSSAYGDVISSAEDKNLEEQISIEQDLMKCWGLISVPLGKRANCNLVAEKLRRFSEKGGLSGALDAEPSNDLNWEQARTQFRTAMDNVRATQAKMCEYELNLSRLNVAVKSFSDSEERLRQALDNLTPVVKEREGLKRRLSDIETQAKSTLDARTILHQEWPVLRQILKWLFDREEYRKFRTRQIVLSDASNTLWQAAAGLRRNCLEIEERAAKLERILSDARLAVAASAKEVTRIEKSTASLVETLGVAAHDHTGFKSLPIDVQQTSLPRNNTLYQEARAAVFVAAMHLHKSFMKHAGEAFDINFQLALGMLERQPHVQELLPTMAPHFWATFFLAVPVVSSTFASFPRCFGNLGEGAIGLLLIDEAGQAVPSNALGAIWRSKRALLVGDPLQVEPVITVNRKLDNEILKYHGAPIRHLLTEYSAQHLADRGNSHGSHVTQYDGAELWVGSPLRVHRRCVAPMFSLSNAIAYNNKMVFGPNPKDEIANTISRPLFGRSRWIHVESDDFDEHFSTAEGLVATQIVIRYQQKKWVNQIDGLPDIFVISPFKSVADGLQNLLAERLKEWAPQADEGAVKKWLKSHVGTVHTFQGKECESVIFVLGGQTAGAIGWGGNKPNIINVAATRAKRRFYVVGNRKKWETSTFGGELTRAFSSDGKDDQFVADAVRNASAQNKAAPLMPMYLP